MSADRRAIVNPACVRHRNVSPKIRVPLAKIAIQSSFLRSADVAQMTGCRVRHCNGLNENNSSLNRRRLSAARAGRLRDDVQRWIQSCDTVSKSKDA
jgi:hypothetical protein